jgi:hypothetical protein
MVSSPPTQTENQEIVMILSASEWAAQQWGQIDLGDERLNRRAAEIGARMAAHPEASLPNQMQSPSMLEAAYRLMDNRHVSMLDLLKPHCQQTLEEARQQEVTLWVEDTTELDYTAHASKTGLGPIGNGLGRGLLLHCTLGLLPESRTVWGLGHVQVVLREARAKDAQGWMRTPEGRLWEHSAQAIGRPPEGKLWVHVSDRGSDIFEYMAACVDLEKHFLLRVFHNRLLTWNDEQPQAEQEEARKLLDYARSLPEYPASGYQVEVAATQKQPARQAQLALAWTQAVIAPSPQAPPEIRQHKPVTAWVVRAWEPDAPSGVEAVEWVLLTSLPILSLEDAQRTADWYTCRWFCEDFHQCLKTGCRVECSQLNDGLDIQKLLGFAAPIAVRLLQLRQDARHAPDALATTLVDPLMVEVLARQLPTESASTLTILNFWRLVARLGGFQGRKRDGQPGWRTVWRGWRYLSDLTDGARLFVSPNSA